jgi:hypothetical protein
MFAAQTLNVERHAASRINDIHYAEGLILRKRKANEIPIRTLFQHVSRGSRRRASSHRPRKFPLRLRLKLAHTDKAAIGATSSNNNRHRRRRRGKYTTSDNARRLLPTHKWHAKRFHFNTPSPWDVKTPDYYSERAERSTIKAACQQCTAHDASYMRVLQLTGPEAEFMSKENDSFPTGFVFKEGYSENVALYDSSSFSSSSSSSSSSCSSSSSSHPRIAVVVDMFCRRATEQSQKLASVLVLVHFSAFKQTQELFAFNLSSGIDMQDCSDEIGRVDISGHNANQVLHRVVIPCLADPTSNTSTLLNKVLRVARPSSLSSNLSMEVIVRDPRASVAFCDSDLKKTKDGIDCRCTLFSRVDRNKASKLVLETSDSAYNAQRHERKQFQGTTLDYTSTSTNTSSGSKNSRKRTKTTNGTTAALVPLLFVRRSLHGVHHHKTLGEGWMLLLPRGAVKTLWQALVQDRSSVIPVGQRHRRAVMVNLGLPSFPFDYPRTLEGERYHHWWWKEKMIQTRKKTAMKEVKKGMVEKDSWWCWEEEECEDDKAAMAASCVKVTCIRRGGRLYRGDYICLPNQHDLNEWKKLGNKYAGGTVKGSKGQRERKDDGTENEESEEDTHRQVVGHITSGGLSHITSPKGIGIGWIRSSSIIALASSSFMMVGTSTSPFYRPIQIEVIPLHMQ